MQSVQVAFLHEDVILVPQITNIFLSVARICYLQALQERGPQTVHKQCVYYSSNNGMLYQFYKRFCLI